MQKTGLTTAAIAAIALGMFAQAAHAQPGAPPPPPPPDGYGGGGGYYAEPPVMERHGFTFGFGFGIGGMSNANGAIQCGNCDYQPASIGFDVHLGGMINPRLALLGEIWGTGQAVDASGTTVLVQTLAMFAVQYWVTPQLWLKGGIGGANLSYSIDDGYDQYSSDVSSGAAFMAAAGYEILSSPRFAIDLQLRLGSGSYDSLGDNINTAMIGMGFNWY